MKRTKYSYIGSIRPTEGLFPGFRFYDTTINKECIWNGTSWDIIDNYLEIDPEEIMEVDPEV